MFRIYHAEFGAYVSPDVPQGVMVGRDAAATWTDRENADLVCAQLNADSPRTLDTMVDPWIVTEASLSAQGERGVGHRMGFLDIFKTKPGEPAEEPLMTNAQSGYIVSLMQQLDINPVMLEFNNAEVTIRRKRVNLEVTTADGSPYTLSRGEASRVITGLLEERDK